MDKNQFRYTRQFLMIICLLVVSALFLQQCSGSSKNRRGKLSDAMEESSDKHKGERKVDTQPDPDYEPEEEEDIDVVGLGAAGLVAEGSQAADSADVSFGSKADWVSIAGGTGLLKEEDFFGLNHFNLAIGTYPADKHYVELTAGISRAPLQETSLLSESLDGGVILLQLSLAYKYYTTPRHTFMGLYLCAGIGYTYMTWSYKNPFQAMAYDEYGNELGMETISSDGLSGFEIYGGLGVNLIQYNRFQIGAEVLPGVILWGGETSEGFDNDVFANFQYTKLKIFLRFGW